MISDFCGVQFEDQNLVVQSLLQGLVYSLLQNWLLDVTSNCGILLQINHFWVYLSQAESVDKAGQIFS